MKASHGTECHVQNRMYEVIDAAVPSNEDKAIAPSLSEPVQVRIKLPSRDGFFHALARGSGWGDYLTSIKLSREAVAKQMRREFADSLDLPADPMNSIITNYETFEFKLSKDEVKKELLENHFLSPEVIEYIAAYVNVRIEMYDAGKTGKILFVTSRASGTKFSIRIGTDTLDYYLLGVMMDGKRLKTRFS